MKILFLTSRFPFPLEKGDKLRSYFFIRELSKYHEIILVSLTEETVEKEHIDELKRFASQVHVFTLTKWSKYWNTFLALFRNYPLQAGYFYNGRFARKINQIVENEKPDHIFCQLLRTALYVKEIRIPKTIDYQDVFSRGVKRRMKSGSFLMKLVLWIEYFKLIRFERRIFSWFRYRIIISATDRDLMPVKEKEKIYVISNGVDFDYFNPELFAMREKKIDVLFTGNMGYPPNVDCALFLIKEVLPALLKMHPDIVMAFAGASPHSSLLKLQSKHVVVTGWVNDLREFYASARVFAAPMRIGTGLQNKLLEAMCMKLPCVTSTLANSALGAQSESQILIADDAESVANQISYLLENNSAAKKMADNAHAFVNENYSWTFHLGLYNALLNT